MIMANSFDDTMKLFEDAQYSTFRIPAFWALSQILNAEVVEVLATQVSIDDLLDDIVKKFVEDEGFICASDEWIDSTEAVLEEYAELLREIKVYLELQEKFAVSAENFEIEVEFLNELPSQTELQSDF